MDDLITKILITVFGCVATAIFNGISGKLGKLTESVERLTQSMGVVLAKLENHEKRLDNLEDEKRR